MNDVPGQGMRTREIEEVTNLRLIHPLSRLFVKRFAGWGLHPNTVSLAGMACGAAAGVAYYHYTQPAMAAAGFALMLGWHVMDGADGQLARLTGQTSEVGKVLDGLCDHLTFTLVYLALCLALTPEWGGIAWAAGVLAGASHVVQSSAYEFQRQAYEYWVNGRASARIVPLDDFRAGLEGRRGLARAFARLNLWYMRLQYRFAACDEGLYRRLEAARDAGASAAVGEAYRRFHLDGVRRWSLLCSNYRTLAIFAACLAGAPLLYFAFEVVVLNATLVALSRLQRRNLSRLERWLAGYLQLSHAA